MSLGHSRWTDHIKYLVFWRMDFSILETDMMTTEKLHFKYGWEDGPHDKFAEAVSKSKFSKIQSHFMKLAITTVV